MERLSHSTVKVKMGTFKSGIANEQVHHWTNLKPAQMRPDAVEAEMVPGGRPKASGPANVHKQTDQPVASSDDKQKQTGPSSKKPKKPAESPTRCSERIRQQTHTTSSLEVRSLSFPAEEAGYSYD